MLILAVSIACQAAAFHPLAPAGTHSLTPHPALETHTRDLTTIASKSLNPVGDRVQLWAALRSHAHRRGSTLQDPDNDPITHLLSPPMATSVLPAHIALRRQASCVGAQSEHRADTLSGSQRAQPTASGIIRPTDFGADPSGRTDSTVAMQAAMAALLQLGSSRNRSTLSSNITDLAGAVLDLTGGEYLLSQGIVVPMFYGNFYITGGTLRASSTFPSTDYLITIGHSGCDPDYAASCNEFIGISNLLLDASHTAAGGLQIVSSMGVTVGPAVFVERFVDVGIRVDGGHETLIHQAWLVEKYWSNIPAPPPSPVGPNAGGPWLALCDGSVSQQWDYTATAAAPSTEQRGKETTSRVEWTPPVLADSIVSKKDGMCMDVDGCDAPHIGTGLLMWGCINSTSGNNCRGTNQQWYLDPKTSQLITAMDKTMCLEAPNMRLTVCDTSNPAQQWQYDTKTTTITNKLSGPTHCLSVQPVPPSPPGPPPPALNNHSVAVQINGNDHYVVDTIIWQYTFIGVELNGAANLLSGVHAWGSGTGTYNYLTGIKVNSYQNRLLGCYLDFNHLDLMSPASIVVESSFFLGTNTRIYGATYSNRTHVRRQQQHASTTRQSPAHAAETCATCGQAAVLGVAVTGLFMQFNIGDSVQVVGNVSSCSGSSVINQGGPLTRATRALSLANATMFKFDFSAALLFNTIDSVSYSVVLAGDGFPSRHVARPAVGKVITVEFESAVDATVHMSVAQCT